MKKLILSTLALLILISSSSYAQSEEVSYVCPPCGSECDDVIHIAPGSCSYCSMQLITEAERDAILRRKKKRVAFYLQDGVEVLDFAGPMEVFDYAGFDVFAVSLDKKPIQSQGILTILPDYSLDDAPEADILSFFGGNSDRASKNPRVIDWVKSQENVELYFSVCTGVFVLAEAEMLNGKEATTFHLALDRLEKDFPEVKVHRSARYVDNGNIITTAGISAGIDGALHLVSKLQGMDSARRIAEHMEYDNWIPGQGLELESKEE